MSDDADRGWTRERIASAISSADLDAPGSLSLRFQRLGEVLGDHDRMSRAELVGVLAKRRGASPDEVADAVLAELDRRRQEPRPDPEDASREELLDALREIVRTAGNAPEELSDVVREVAERLGIAS